MAMPVFDQLMRRNWILSRCCPLSAIPLCPAFSPSLNWPALFFDFLASSSLLLPLLHQISVFSFNSNLVSCSRVLLTPAVPPQTVANSPLPLAAAIQRPIDVSDTIPLTLKRPLSRRCAITAQWAKPKRATNFFCKREKSLGAHAFAMTTLILHFAQEAPTTNELKSLDCVDARLCAFLLVQPVPVLCCWQLSL